jgi:S-adenosylmethionine:tRNA ribosyltransferase-isomerase
LEGLTPPAADLGFPALPEDLIAQTPLAERDAARLLVVDRSTGRLDHRVFRDLPDWLAPGDALVLNDVRVAPVRLRGRKGTGGKIQFLLLARFPGGDARWTSLVTPRPKVGQAATLSDGTTVRVAAARPEGEYELVFDRPPDLERCGEVPLPPYIKRPTGDAPGDREYYQNVYARATAAEYPAAGPAAPLPPGAVAAPTAGLHFTPALLKKIEDAGVDVVRVTLWVGWGTFRPVTASDYRAHPMLPELYRVTEDAARRINAARSAGRRVWAVGTTVVRTLESAFRGGAVVPETAEARLFITPGHRFRSVDRLVTNFHMPGHTPLLLTAAFTGVPLLRSAYQEAMDRRYRFLSYGDAMAVL